MLLCLPSDFDKLSIDELYENYGSPAPEPVVRFDGQPLESGVPSSVVPPIWLGKSSEDFSPAESKVFLGDFGEGYRPSTQSRHESHAPLSFRPPEAQFEPEHGLSFPADIWTLACCIWIILGQRPLFEDIFATTDDITAEQVDVLGKLPLQWWEKWAARHEYFDEGGKPNQDRQVRSCEDRYEKHIQIPREQAGFPCFDGEEKAAVLDMVRSMLSFEPEKRPTAQDVLKCEWMERWAIPDMEKSRFRKCQT
ncbi:hypothetical protein N7452_001387 [Penicillium brevicompactum]|uniref:Protein kinase domain-containing protein n=1 Tax=Penicillium brevicompactum TaxID=5074 RepID=A0A9W9R296_PENBR|nr:hypothetical protein N7452_001387 [Penicillium brevicompactum]